jgi:hypothetical protein
MMMEWLESEFDFHGSYVSTNHVAGGRVLEVRNWHSKAAINSVSRKNTEVSVKVSIYTTCIWPL